jgi:hypothetical protein
MLQDLGPEGARFERPFTVADESSFWKWLWEPSPDSRAGLPRFAVAIWRTESVLREVFPDALHRDGDLYAEWLASGGLESMGADDALVRRFSEYRASMAFRGGVPPDLGMLLTRRTSVAWMLKQSERDLETLRRAIDDLQPPIPAAGLALFRERDDLREAWPDPLGQDRAAIAEWLCTHGVAEHGLTAAIVGRTYLALPDSTRAHVLEFLSAAAPATAVELRVLEPPPELPPVTDHIGARVALRRLVDDAHPSLPALALAIYHERPDLAASWPDPTGADREAFAVWLCTSGWREYRLDEEDLRSTLESLALAQRDLVLAWRAAEGPRDLERLYT